MFKVGSDMSKRILIDGAFKDETRVALIENDILQDYDREDFSFKQLKGNIYLAKITRIEPSLQAAFIDYGGDRHGFLPFSDIHPDYYNIPEDEIRNLKAVKFFQSVDNLEELEKGKSYEDDEQRDSSMPDDDASGTHSDLTEDTMNLDSASNTSDEDDDSLDVIPNYSVDEESEATSSTDYTQYKIEDVIKEGQCVLVQVLKEERGNKGVAMTTYISIAGKYCVLMVNSPDRGGVSKKVINLSDRKILKSILRSLNVPDDKSVILRTAGVGKKPEEILKDYLYLIRLWGAIREATLDSKAPSFIHAEDDIIKKTVRDLYTDDVDEVLVEGNDIFKSVKGLIKIISNNGHEAVVKLYNEKIPLFQRYNVEGQLLELYNNKVNLPSGGSIVIDQTEALVAIDVNSGKATKEKSVEEMAVATNIEAANEIARQLKLRDLAGLVVIDFIDMFELRNRRIVERAMRDAMLNDRARIQIARLSIFGLMELSRQRLGASFMERTSEVCPRCRGKGKIKSKEIVALSILRSMKYAATDKQINVITVETTLDLCQYLLNFKRKDIVRIENDYDVYIFIEENEDIEDNNYNIKKRKGLTSEERKDLEPQQKSGKVNLDFGDNELYSVSNAEIKKYKFDEETYGNGERNFPKKVVKKQYNRYSRSNFNDKNSKKTSWFKRLFGIR